MSLHLTGEAAALITKLIGSTNRLVLLTVTGISLVQFACIRGVTSTGWHLVTNKPWLRFGSLGVPFRIFG